MGRAPGVKNYNVKVIYVLFIEMYYFDMFFHPHLVRSSRPAAPPIKESSDRARLSGAFLFVKFAQVFFVCYKLKGGGVIQFEVEHEAFPNVWLKRARSPHLPAAGPPVGKSKEKGLVTKGFFICLFFFQVK